MAIVKPTAFNSGYVLRQDSGEYGGSRPVFVELKGIKNDLVFPTFGMKLLNPFPQYGKMFAGDLAEFTVDGVGYLLKTYGLSKATLVDDTTIYIKNDKFRHIPNVGDVLMKAPDVVTTTGKAVTVLSVIDEAVDGIKSWKVTISAALGVLDKDTVLVEAEEAGDDKSVLVKNPNTFIPNDLDFIYSPASSDSDFNGARYFITPALHGTAWEYRMSPIPPYVETLNKSNVKGWFIL